MSSIPSSQLLTLSQNPTFVNNILKAPEVLQEKFVQKIISIDETEAVVNVPNELATYIPRVLLASLNTVKISVVNQKNWNQGQAVVLFGPVASATSNLILQGFTSTSAQALPVQKVIQLVHACRLRPGRSKVPLQESQLTSMYTYVKNDTSLTFSDVPPDMLLYYDYEMVPKVNCSSYFSALGRADFSVPSSFLNRQNILFNNAESCLGISGFNLNKTQVDILGNMTCTLNSSYIQKSDPLIIEKLKNCGDLTDSQVSGIQTLLFSGNTNYGNLSTWNLQTLQQLGPLPLYLNQYFWNKFNFVYTTIADQSFILSYTSTQFDLCLNVTVLINNLVAITQIVVDPSMEMVILNKLNQAYPSGLGDSVVQLLGSTSRVANVSEINSWNITSLDTLATLMNPVNGAWTSDQVTNPSVFVDYELSSRSWPHSEINAIMSDICSLNTSALSKITAENLR
uniref:Lipid-binding serum glycoprotein C-terminal domain-containing protein n=1 Tax=Electrophorus electricus TaxID=8005 RepID=A0AAY5EZ19_ELEEL